MMQWLHSCNANEKLLELSMYNSAHFSNNYTTIAAKLYAGARGWGGAGGVYREQGTSNTGRLLIPIKPNQLYTPRRSWGKIAEMI